MLSPAHTHVEEARPPVLPAFVVSGRGSRVVWVSDRGLPCHEFEPSTTKDPPCKAAICRELKRPPVGVVVRRGGCQLRFSSSSLDHGSKLRGASLD
ncbi:hypothetical protein TNCV_1867151 [Trichonephila clavipes]|nr:hypothetical protein TNCV_1867151 [Trichonephila clavipes]